MKVNGLVCRTSARLEPIGAAKRSIVHERIPLAVPNEPGRAEEDHGREEGAAASRDTTFAPLRAKQQVCADTEQCPAQDGE